MENLNLIQCYKCLHFNHLKANCPNSDTICSRCSQTHTYPWQECQRIICCANCQSPHVATARVCPKYVEAFLANEQLALKQLAIRYPQLSNFRPNLRDKNQNFKKLGPSASLRAIRMCLRPKLDNSNNALASSEALGCASCHLLCLCIITIFYNA